MLNKRRQLRTILLSYSRMEGIDHEGRCDEADNTGGAKDL